MNFQGHKGQDQSTIIPSIKLMDMERSCKHLQLIVETCFNSSNYRKHKMLQTVALYDDRKETIYVNVKMHGDYDTKGATISEEVYYHITKVLQQVLAKKGKSISTSCHITNEGYRRGSVVVILGFTPLIATVIQQNISNDDIDLKNALKAFVYFTGTGSALGFGIESMFGPVGSIVGVSVGASAGFISSVVWNYTIELGDEVLKSNVSNIIENMESIKRIIDTK